jgi:hypothetical protein
MRLRESGDKGQGSRARKKKILMRRKKETFHRHPRNGSARPTEK